MLLSYLGVGKKAWIVFYEFYYVYTDCCSISAEFP